MNRSELNKLIKKMQEELPSELLGLEIVEIEWVGSNRTLRIFIDKDGGIVHEDCIAISKWADAAMQLDSLFEDAYSLEVSSPGIDRPLRKINHFAANLGNSVQITLTEPFASRRKAVGTIVDIDSTKEEVTMNLDEGVVWKFPLGLLGKARLKYSFANSKGSKGNKVQEN